MSKKHKKKSKKNSKPIPPKVLLVESVASTLIEKNNAVEENPPEEDEAFQLLEPPLCNPESDPFLYSLINLSPDQIAEEVPKPRRTLLEWFFVSARYVLLFISISVFCYSAYSIIENLVAYKKTDELYGSLQDEFFGEMILSKEISTEVTTAVGAVLPSPKSPKAVTLPNFETALKQLNETAQQPNLSETNAEKPVNQLFEQMKIKLYTLQSKNPDTYGWIKIENNNINFPIVQRGGGDQNQYYLDHDFTGSYLPMGSIFADFRCHKEIMKNYNTILYGHNVRSGSMFNGVTKFLDEEFFRNNGKIQIYTFDGIYTYEVFSIYETRMDYNFIQTAFRSGAEFVAFANTVKANSLYQKDISFTETDRILTLSTCTNGAMTGRYALHAKLIEVSK